MKCDLCKADPVKDPEIILRRINEKSGKSKWRCTECLARVGPPCKECDANTMVGCACG